MAILTILAAAPNASAAKGRANRSEAWASQPAPSPFSKRLAGWEVDLDGGASIPLNSKVDFPAITGLFQTDRSIFAVIGQPIRKPLRTSGLVEMAALRRVRPWLSAGLQMSCATSHGMAIGDRDLFQNSRYAYLSTDASFGFRLNYSMRILGLSPIIKIGPTLASRTARWRPYALFGLGWYNVRQGTSLTLDDKTFQFKSQTDNCAGASLGGGLDWKLENGWYAGVELKYQRLFRPAGSLQFFIPTVRTAYLF